MEIGIDHPNDAQLKSCWDKINALQVGEALKVKNYAPNKPKLFIKCCEMYHDCFKNIEINNTHTEIRKTFTFNEQLNRFNQQ